MALRVFLDLDTETTARTLGIAVGAVTAHLARSRCTDLRWYGAEVR